jgi:hypothetical protein
VGGTAATLSGILADPFLVDVLGAERGGALGPDALSIAAAAAANNNAAAAAGQLSAGGGAAAAAAAGAGSTGSAPVPAAAAAAAAAAAGPTGGSFTAGGPAAADALGVGGDAYDASGFVGGAAGSFTSSARRSVVSGSMSKRVMAQAKGVLSSGAAALSGSVGGALAAASQRALPAPAPLPRSALWEAPPPARAALPATLKQELACTLLSALARHPAAAAALQLPPGRPVVPPPSPFAAAASSSAPDQCTTNTDPQQQQQQQQPARPQFGPDDVATSAVVASLQAGVVVWLGAALAGLTATRAALHWEPLVLPPLPGQPPAPPLPPMASVNLTTVCVCGGGCCVCVLGVCVVVVGGGGRWGGCGALRGRGARSRSTAVAAAGTHVQHLRTERASAQHTHVHTRARARSQVPVDLWLQLLQAACHAVRGVVRLHGYDSLKAIYRSNGGRMLPALSPWDVSGVLAATCEAAAAGLQGLLVRGLAEWRGLALAVRPR